MLVGLPAWRKNRRNAELQILHFCHQSNVQLYGQRCRRHNTVPLSLIRSTVTASVRRPMDGGGAGSAPSKSATGSKLLPPHCSVELETERQSRSNEYRIKKRILWHYDRTTRPVRDDANAVDVLIAISLSHILDTVCVAIRFQITNRVSW